MRKFEVEVTRVETRTYKATVTVETDQVHDTEELDEQARWEDAVRDKADEAARKLTDSEWTETTDLRSASESYDTGEIEEVHDAET